MDILCRTLVKSNVPFVEIVQQIMGYSAASKVFNEYLHRRLVCKGTILLVEPKVIRMKMDDQ